MRPFTSLVMAAVLVLALGAPVQAQLGYDDLVTVPGSGPSNVTRYDDGQFAQILAKEQRLFTDAQYHQNKPLRSYTRNYPRHFRVVDSWFDVFWDTPAYRTSKSDGASLISFMFRDVAAFKPTGGRSFFSITDFVNIGQARWQGSRQAYPVYGYYALMDFSKRNEDLVKKFMSNVAAFSFHQYFHAYRQNNHSRAFTFQRIIHFLEYYKLPVICLLPNTNETVLVYKVVIRDDGQAAMFYYRPSDDPFYRKANEQWMKNVIFVRSERNEVVFFNNAQYDNRNMRFYGGLDDVLIIDNMAQIYAEVAPMLRLSAVVADITGKGDPIRGGMFLGTVLGNLFGPGTGDEKAGNIATLLLGTAAGGMPPSQQAMLPPPTSQTLQWPQEYPYGVHQSYIPQGQTGLTYSQQQQSTFNYTPGQYAGDVLFPKGNIPVAGSTNYPGGQLPVWVMDEKPRTFDFNAFFRTGYANQTGQMSHDPRLPVRDHPLPPERYYPDKGGVVINPGQQFPNPGQQFPNPGQQFPNPGQQFPPIVPVCPPVKPPVYLPPCPPQLPPYCPEPPVIYPPRPPVVFIPPKPPKPPVYIPPKPPVYFPPKPPVIQPPRPPLPPRPPKPPVILPPKPPHPPLPPKPPHPPKPPKPPFVSHCNEEYPNQGSKGHLFSGKRTGTGPGKFKLIGECYDDEFYNKFGYDEDGYDRKGYDPWGEDRRGYDKRGYDPWGYDRKGEDPHGDKSHDTRLHKYRAAYHSKPLKFRMHYAIGTRTGTIVRRKDRKVMWSGDSDEIGKPFDGNDTDQTSSSSSSQTGSRPHGNIDTSKPTQTNQQGHVIQYSDPGKSDYYQHKNNTQQQTTKPSNSMTTPAQSTNQTVNTPISTRQYRDYHRK